MPPVRMGSCLECNLVELRHTELTSLHLELAQLFDRIRVVSNLSRPKHDSFNDCVKILRPKPNMKNKRVTQ